MNEYQFVRLNRDRWESFEKDLLRSESLEPDELLKNYVQLSDDLALAQTFFPDSPTAKYLNRLTAQVHQKIYIRKKSGVSQVRQFFLIDVPDVSWRQRRSIYAASLIFMFFCFIGFFSASQDASYIRIILGDSYVRMTEENIHKGDPLGVYGNSAQSDMFTRIASNNVNVAFRAYILGLLATIGTVLLLMFNGAMLGAFMQFFFAKGLGTLAFSTVFLHGALEISAIMLAGGAGLMLGSGFLFPGTYSRSRSFINGAKDSIRLMLSLVPIFIIAAGIESFVTRYYLDIGAPMRWIIVFLSFLVIAWYYFYYPYKLFSSGEKTMTEKKQLLSEELNATA